MNIKIVRYFDWFTFAVTIALLLLGLLFVYSATYTPELPYSTFFKRQLFGVVSGLCIYFVCSFTDIRLLIQWGYYGFFLTVLLLLYTILGGRIAKGGQRWISLGFTRFQPSEIAKITVPFFMGVYISEHYLTQANSQVSPPFKVFLVPLCVLIGCSLLIMKQPDLGTALLVLGLGLIMLWAAGLSTKFFIITGLLGVLCAPILWKNLKPYQQKRILTLLGEGSSQNERYQIEQSKIAIGSGGLRGKGFLKGTQNKLSFLPEDHTDFIFSVVCEEWGFIGAFVVITLFWLLFIQLFILISSLSSLIEMIIALGLTSFLILSVIINIGMVIGILPTVGIPLPFISYGITHSWISLAALGILQNLSIRRFCY